MNQLEAAQALRLLEQFDQAAARSASREAGAPTPSRLDAAAWAWAAEMDPLERDLFSRIAADEAVALLAPRVFMPCRFEPDAEGARSRRMLRAGMLARRAALRMDGQEAALESKKPWIPARKTLPWKADDGAWATLARVELAASEAGPWAGLGGCVVGVAGFFCGMPAVSSLAGVAAIAGTCAAIASQRLARSPKAPTKRHALAALTRAYPDLAAEGFFDSLCDPAAYAKDQQSESLDARARWSAQSCLRMMQSWGQEPAHESPQAMELRGAMQGRPLADGSARPWTSGRLASLRDEAALVDSLTPTKSATKAKARSL
jgi:hypothetical protein